MKLASAALAAALAAVFPIATLAQPPVARPAADAAAPRPAADAAPARPSCVTSGEVHTFYLNNAVQQADANEVVTALRNILSPCDKIYLVFNQSAILMQAPADRLELAQKIINDLDRPKKSYRLTYTVSEFDAGKLVGTQHFAMIVASGQQTVLKQGSKVPIATGSYDSGSAGSKGPAGVQTQFTYIDLGMNFDATLDEFANGVRLRSDVAQSSVAGENSIAGVTEPVIHQTELKGAAFLAPGKPLVLGSIDIPSSTRRLDIEVVMEQLP